MRSGFRESAWLGRIDKDAKEEQKNRVFDLYLACFTQEEIAERLDISQQTVSDTLPDLARSPNPVKLRAEHTSMARVNGRAPT